mgnify:CR=1 FL=1
MRATKEYRLKVTEEAQKIVDQLTLEQKVSLMSGSIVDLNKVTQEQIMEMMGGMLSDDNHYNMTPYPAGRRTKRSCLRNRKINLLPGIYGARRDIFTGTGRKSRKLYRT